jgi:ribosome-associated toxin RatA of RatAB toxin-antitoxin module
MPQESRTIEVQVDPKKFFEVVTDYKSYPEFLKDQGLRRVTVHKEEGNIKVITQELEILGRRVEYTLRMVEDKANQHVSWTLVKGLMMSVNSGSWRIEKMGPGRSRVTYSIELKLGMLIPSMITTKLAATQLPAMLNAFKRRAESMKKKSA